MSTSQSGNSVLIKSMSISCGMQRLWFTAGSEPDLGRAMSAESVMWRGCVPLRVGV